MTLPIGSLRVEAPAVLAPMAGITDLSFRLLCREQGAGLAYTELVSAEGLLRGGRQTAALLRTEARERPMGVQLFGSDPDRLAEAAAMVEDLVPCDLVDLNMGCPVPKVVSRGAGAALMRRPDLVFRLVEKVAAAVRLPVTAKIRSGWTETEINAPEVARAIAAGGGACVAVHARTRAQRHEGRPDWDLLAEIAAGVPIPVIGNGGILGADDALRMKRETGVAAVMVGRGAIGNPWIFRQIGDLWRGGVPSEPTSRERVETAMRHLAMTTQGFVAAGHKDARRRACGFIRGHLVQYVAGFRGAGEFRRALNDLCTPEDVEAALLRVFPEGDAVPRRLAEALPLPSVEEDAAPSA